MISGCSIVSHEDDVHTIVSMMSFDTEGARMLLAHSGHGQSLTALLVKASIKTDLTSSTIASSVSYENHKPSDTTSYSHFNKKIRTSSRSVLVTVARFIPPNSTAAT